MKDNDEVNIYYKLNYSWRKKKGNGLRRSDSSLTWELLVFSVLA